MTVWENFKTNHWLARTDGVSRRSPAKRGFRFSAERWRCSSFPSTLPSVRVSALHDRTRWRGVVILIAVFLWKQLPLYRNYHHKHYPRNVQYTRRKTNDKHHALVQLIRRGSLRRSGIIKLNFLYTENYIAQNWIESSITA